MFRTIIRTVVLCTLVSASLIGGDVIASDAEAADLVQRAMTDLRAGDNDPQKTVIAALQFAQVLDYYKTKGDVDQVCEIQANIYWCKKRMNLDDLRTYAASKGTPESDVVARVDGGANLDVPKDQAALYLTRADLFSQGNTHDPLAIAIRYFEVADRFTGTTESLKAQRLSLDFMRKCSSADGGHEDSIGKEIHAQVLVGAELPEPAKKVTDASNAAVKKMTAKASGDIEPDRQHLLDALIKIAEGEQKKGILDTLLAVQNQISHPDVPQTDLPEPAQIPMGAYVKAKQRIIDKVNASIIAEKRKLLLSLEKIQTDSVKNGDSGGALAIKSLRNSIISEIAGVTDTLNHVPIKMLVIPANSEGELIGDLVKGQLIELFYSEGRWGDGGALNDMSPDDPATPGGCRMEMVKPDGSTTLVGTHTAKEPWRYTVSQNGKYLVRICDSSRPGNPGSVTYKVVVRDP